MRNYIKRHPSLGRVVAEVVEQNLDLAEHKLLGFINEGNMTAVIFYLKTKGRERVIRDPAASVAPAHRAQLECKGSGSLAREGICRSDERGGLEKRSPSRGGPRVRILVPFKAAIG